MFRVPTNVFV
jgi:hypothetical protein